MFHQPNNLFDFEFTLDSQPRNDFMINLLVKKEILKLSNMTSNPKRVLQAVTYFVGVQTRHQIETGRMWFMREMMRRKIFTHELQVKYLSVD